MLLHNRKSTIYWNKKKTREHKNHSPVALSLKPVRNEFPVSSVKAVHSLNKNHGLKSSHQASL